MADALQATGAVSDATAFTELGLTAPLLEAVEAVGYETPTAIQARAIPALLAGRDLVGQAQTGTGKTAAFALPILQDLDLEPARVQAVVLTPTRELALQVAEAFHTYGKRLGRLRVLPVYGGQSMEQQVRRLRAGVHVVVGTPGRLMDHLRRFAFVDVPAAFADQVLERMRRAKIRNRPVTVKCATPRRKRSRHDAA